ncbi:hypothetical protein LCGC14_0912530 [marine sediment metagenome]|uniref:Uncharacterized protein n=1 Tax=marine sediment metagenome TaxID=412755 RepID=A0A0F9NXT2_9ZZZZ
MGFRDFLGKFAETRRSRSFQKQLKLKEKEEAFESKAFGLEQEAELRTSVGKKRKRIKEARRKIFEESSFGRISTGLIGAGKQIEKAARFTRKAARKAKFGGFGSAQEDLFFGGETKPQRRSRKRRRNKQQTENDLFGDIGDFRF